MYRRSILRLNADVSREDHAPERHFAPAGQMRAFLGDEGGGMTIDWLVITGGLMLAGVAVVGVIGAFGSEDGFGVEAAVEQDARAHAERDPVRPPSDPGERYAPSGPVFDPGGRDPGPTAAPGSGLAAPSGLGTEASMPDREETAG